MHIYGPTNVAAGAIGVAIGASSPYSVDEMAVIRSILVGSGLLGNDDDDIRVKEMNAYVRGLMRFLDGAPPVSMFFVCFATR